MKNRGLLGRLGRPWRRNATEVVTGAAKVIGVEMLRGGIGFTTSMVAGQIANAVMPSSYSPLIGNALTVILAEVLGSKVEKVRELTGMSFTVGAATAAYVSIMNLLVEKSILTGTFASYLAPWSGATLPVVLPANTVVTPAGTGAYIAQRGLYGMGAVGPASPIERSMQHRLKMIEGGMSGGIFDSKTTLGEYDVLESAPAGTNVQGALADYEVYPPRLGSVDVRAATAGLGANVEEAFAGFPSLKEYVSVPLSDYVPTGGQVQYHSNTAEGQAIFGQIREAARRITQKRLAEGKPVDARFQADLVKAATQVASNGDKDVSMAAPGAPLTVTGAPFPGSAVMNAGGVAGQSVSIGDDSMEDDGGIFH